MSVALVTSDAALENASPALRLATQDGVPVAVTSKLNDATVHGSLDPELLAATVEFSHSKSGRATWQGDWSSTKMTVAEFLASLSRHIVGKKDGHCILQGCLVAGDRKSKAIKWNDLLILDLDQGEPLESIHEKVRKLGKLAVVYTTHSNGACVTEISRDAVLKHLGSDDEPGLAEVVSYLTEVRGYYPSLLDGAELAGAEHGTDGVVIKVRHKPMTKARVVFVLARRFSFSDGGKQSDRISLWKEKVLGAAKMLGIVADRSCTDPARLFYSPRHTQGASWGIDIFAGDFLEIDDVPRVTLASLKAGRDDDNPFAVAAREMGGGSAGYETTGLKWFFAKYGNRFDLADFLDEVDPDGDRGARSSGPGRAHRCPNDDAHSDAGNEEDRGFFCVNALDDDRETCVAKCMHDSCADLDRINFVDLACVAGGIKDATELLRWVPELEGEDRDTDGAREGAHAVAEDDEQTAKLRQLNKEYAVVAFKGNVRIMREPRKPDAMPDFLGTDAFRTLLANEKVWIGAGDDAKPVPLSKLWIEWEHRRDYKGGVVFEPDGSRVACAEDEFNLWSGFPVKGKAGDWSLLRGHILDNICKGDAEHFDWLMTWLAQMFQQPGVKLGSAVAIKGRKGTGKSKLWEWVREAMGRRHSVQVTRTSEITGHFNAVHQGKILCVCEEAFWAGDKEAKGTLKSLITSPTSMIEQKGVDAIEMSNYMRFAFVSNEEWVVPVDGADERRFFVLECGEGRIQDRAFFKAVDHQMEAGGLEAMVAELMAWTPPGGDWDVLREPPKGRAHLSQALAGMGPLKTVLPRLAMGDAIGAKGREDGPSVRLLTDEGDGTVSYLPKDAFRSVLETHYGQAGVPSDRDLTAKLQAVFGAEVASGRKRFSVYGGVEADEHGSPLAGEHDNRKRVWILPNLATLEARMVENGWADPE